MSYEQFEGKYGKRAKPWRLAGSMRPVPGVDIDEAIREIRESMRDALEARMARYGCDDKA